MVVVLEGVGLRQSLHSQCPWKLKKLPSFQIENCLFSVIPETVPDFFSGDDENESRNDSASDAEITVKAKPSTALEKLNAVLKDADSVETKRGPGKTKSLRTPQRRHTKSVIINEDVGAGQTEFREKPNKKTPTKVTLKDKSLSTSSDDMSMTIDGPPSPVFGKTAPVSAGRRLSSAAEKSLESPSLFDDDDPIKSANDKSIGDTSFEGLNIRRRVHNRKSPKSVGHENNVSGHDDVPSTSRAGSLKSPAKSRASGTGHHRQVLQEIDNLDDPNESTSPSVLSGKIRNFRNVGSPGKLNQNGAVNLCVDSDGVIDLEKAMNDGESLSQRTRSQRRKKIEGNSGPSLEVSSPSSRPTRGKKLVQSKIPKDYFRRKKTDLSTSMEFNGGKLNGSTNLTPEEQEALNIELAIQESLKEQDQRKSQERSQGQSEDDDSILERVMKKSLEDVNVKGQAPRSDLPISPVVSEVRNGQKGQSEGLDLHRSLDDTEVRGQREGQSNPLDLDLNTEMTAPAFTSTPFVTNAHKKKTNFTTVNTLVDSEELFKKPTFLPKSPRTPKRRKPPSENDSPRRSPRLNKNSANKGRTENAGQGQGQSPRMVSRSRKQLNLTHDADKSTDIDRDITLPDLVPPGLNGSVDPLVRLSEFDESHLAGKSGTNRLMDKSGNFHLVGRSRRDLLERTEISGTLVARSRNYEDSRSNIEQGTCLSEISYIHQYEIFCIRIQETY